MRAFPLRYDPRGLAFGSFRLGDGQLFGLYVCTYLYEYVYMFEREGRYQYNGYMLSSDSIVYDK